MDPAIPNAADRATKLRSQQEVSFSSSKAIFPNILILASRTRLYFGQTSDWPASAHKVECQNLLSGMACKEFETYASRYVVFPLFSFKKKILILIIYPDVVDYVEPTMLIVGSRGLGQLNG